MRLLDLISQGHTAYIDGSEGAHLPTPAGFASQLTDCPLRYILSDELVMMATSLAFAEGDRLDSCLDLVHIPAQRLWVEWADTPRNAVVQELLPLSAPSMSEHSGQRSGAYVVAQRGCRSGTVYGFWATGTAGAILSPLIAEFDLDRPVPIAGGLDEALAGGWIRVTHPANRAVDAVLGHFRYRLDPWWVKYYRAHGVSPGDTYRILRGNLNGLAFDGPMLLAFFLLLSAKDALAQRPSDLGRLNRARARGGKQPLLEYIEVHSPLHSAACAPAEITAQGSVRRAARLHHVRGHLVRRGTSVFWRSPHLRGSLRWGKIRARTVTLHCTSSLGQPAGQQ